MPFAGLVGHCIGVDPYYLMHRANMLGLDAELVTAGRRINNQMPEYAVSKLVKKLITKGKQILNANVLVLGYTFKEDCPDVRNTKVFEFVMDLMDYGIEVSVCDPLVSNNHREDVDITFVESPELASFDAVVLAVPHSEFLELGVNGIRNFCNGDGLFFDLKSAYAEEESDLRL